MTKTITIPTTPAITAARAEYLQANQRYADACEATHQAYKSVEVENRKAHDVWRAAHPGIHISARDKDPIALAILKPYHDAQAAARPLADLRRVHELRLLAEVHTELSHHKHHIPVATVAAKGKKWQYFFDGEEARTSGASSPYTSAGLVLNAEVTETEITAAWYSNNQYSMKRTQMEKTIAAHSAYLTHYKQQAGSLSMDLSWRTVDITVVEYISRKKGA
jgi:hypothetical protein